MRRLVIAGVLVPLLEEKPGRDLDNPEERPAIEAGGLR